MSDVKAYEIVDVEDGSVVARVEVLRDPRSVFDDLAKRVDYERLWIREVRR